MEEKTEKLEQNIEENNGVKAEEMTPAAGSVVDDDIEYTFVVPKGEVYREPEPEDETPEPETPEPVMDEPEPPDGIPEPVIIEPEPAEEPEEEPEEAPEPAKTIVADRKSFTEKINDALADAAWEDGNFFDSDDDFFEAYKAADPTGRTAYVEPPVYDATGLPEDDDITYTFVVPKGEIYQEPDPEEERAAKAAERARRRLLAAETKVMQREGKSDDADADRTHYGLPANHPEMGELAQKQEERRLYKQKKKNRFRTRFYVLATCIVLLIGWLILSNSGLFTIDVIEVKGNSHYTAEEIINIGHATSGRNIIYKANIKEVTEFLEQNPYIRKAEVRRKLPSTLVIKVTERKERLAFKYDDDYLVMDEDGILLKKTRNKPKTTIIQGVVVNKIKLGEKIGTENSRRMDSVLEIIKMMIKSDLYYVKLDISNEKEVKAYIYDTLVVKTDYDTLMTNMENGKLHLVMEKLFEDGIERGTITFLEDGSASFMPTF